jgi:hypothetical protein
MWMRERRENTTGSALSSPVLADVSPGDAARAGDGLTDKATKDIVCLTLNVVFILRPLGMEKSFLLSTFLKFLHDFCKISVFQRRLESAGHMTATHNTTSQQSTPSVSICNYFDG